MASKQSPTDCECYEKTVFGGCVHLVVLGSGASKALVDDFGGTDKTGKILPVMNELIKVTKINEVLKNNDINIKTKNIEEFYSEHLKTIPKSLISKIERVIWDYFFDMIIPDSPTIYDYLILSLRKKDAIATFNWDPLLLQAYRRIGRIIGESKLPELIFLHGNVSVGYCSQDNIPGFVNSKCSKCGQIFEPSTILYPTANKNYEYENDPFIRLQWKMLDYFLKRARLVSIFGYGKPVSDAAAINYFQKSWGTKDNRSLEQFELILKPGISAESARNKWDDLIHTHHYHVAQGFYDSWLYRYPRRTGEHWFCQFLQNSPLKEHLPPQGIELVDLIDWYNFLFVEEERNAKIMK